MYNSNLTLLSAMESGYGRKETQEQSCRQALAIFWQVYFSGKVAGLWSKLTGRDNSLRKLDGQTSAGERHAAGLQTVALSQIRGSEGRSSDFDASFHPQTLHTRDRWLSVASAYLRNIPLPPVELIRVRDSYYVRDGNHRISVAHAFGQENIEALVTVWA